MSEFHFLRPAWFLALVPLLVLLVLLWRQRTRATQWQGIVAPGLLPHLLLDSASPACRLPLVLLGSGWLLAVTALAGPVWQQLPQAVYRAPSDRVIVLDMSPSMAAADLKPDRLTRARFAIRSLLSALPEGRTALVVFSGEPHVVAPLTDDVATVEALLPALSVDIMPAPGDHAAPALRKAGELLQRVGSTRGEVLLLSDGVDDPADSLAAIHALRSRGVQTSVLGVGTAQGAPVPGDGGGFAAGQTGGVALARLDTQGLTALARAGGGRYQRLGEGRLQDLVATGAGHDLAHARAADPAGVARWVEEGPWLLLPLLLLAAGGFRRGWLAAVTLVVLVPPPAQAFSWQDLWLRPDQQASRLLEQGDAAAAAGRFQHPDWQGTAQYRAGDYAAAAKSFTTQDSDGAYNRANALARAGRLQEAMAAYAAALKLDAGNEDARFNRKLVEQLLQQQQSSSQAGDSAKQSQTPPGGAGQDKVQQQSGSGQAGETRQQAGAGGQAAANGRDDGAGQPAPAGGKDAQVADGDNRNAGRQATQRAPEARSGNSGEPPGHAASAARDQQQAQRESGAQPGDRGNPPPAQDNLEAAKRSERAGAQADSDSAERARADVAPAVTGEDGGKEDTPVRPFTRDSAPPGAAPGGQSRQAMSEQDLALEQWLHQVPDDPAGLLRRKFMLEHLLRQKGRETP